MQKKSKTSIYTELANRYNVPYNVVEVICNHPFKFAAGRIADDDDQKDILFAYLFRLKIKKKYKNEEPKGEDTESGIG